MTAKHEYLLDKPPASESEVLFRGLFENSSDAIQILDNFTFVECNQATVEILHAKNKAEVLATHPSKLSPEFQPDGRPSGEKADEMIRTAMEKGGHRFEWMHRRVDGEDFPVEVTLTPVTVGGKTMLYSSWRDIADRKQAEAQVRTFQALVENSADAITMSDLQGNISYANRAAYQLLGYEYEKQELIGKVTAMLAAPEERERQGQAIAQIMATGGSWNDEATASRLDGSKIEASISMFPVLDANDQPAFIAAILRDITERKRIENRLNESEERYRRLSDATVEGIVIHDKGILLDANEVFAEMFGYEHSEVIGMPATEFLTPETREITAQNIRSGYEKPYEVMGLRKDGSTFPVEITGKAIPYEGRTVRVTALRDITERKQAEDELLQQREKFRMVADFTYDWEYWLGTDNKYAYVSPSVKRITGHEVEEFMQTPHLFVDITHPDDKHILETHMHEFHAAHSDQAGEVELRIVRPDGSERWLSHLCQPVYDDNGMWLGRRGSNRDITEQKQLETEIRQAFERRGYQVQVSTEISQQISQATELGDLFERVVTLTKERLGYYHTQLLRYDPNQKAVVLTAGYGETGQKMFAEGHHIPMGSGLIGTAAASGETVMRSELAQDPDWKPNPLLPDTKGEIAVPIKLGDEVLGVLDVQSDTANALTDDDRLLLEGLCGQIAIAMEQTRLRQEMEERLQEINNLYRAMSHEGWQTYRETAALPGGFIYDQVAIRPVEETSLTTGLFANAPMVLPGGETLGELGLADDPDKPLSEEDKAFLEQVSEQVALALESARLSEQTQLALSQSERLFDASRSLTQSADLQELVTAAVTTLGISEVNRALLTMFDYDPEGEVEQMTIVANWWNETGHEVTPIGTRYSPEEIRTMPMFVSPTPIFLNDTINDELVDEATMEFVKRWGLRSVAVLPLHLGSKQLGTLILEAEEPHNFTQDETRLFESLAPQIATVVENRQQYEKAQRQAEREAMLNAINQKIQSATSVEAVLQIAARELGHALGAPMTIAQLSMKDQN